MGVTFDLKSNELMYMMARSMYNAIMSIDAARYASKCDDIFSKYPSPTQLNLVPHLLLEPRVPCRRGRPRC